MIEAQKENLNINKLIAEKKEIIFVEGDMIVPDSKPDILNTICTSGVVSIYKKEVLDEKVKMDGSINTYIMYMPDDNDDRVRGLNTTLDFSENINIPNVREGMEVLVKSNIKSIETKVINGRKIGIKANIEICLKVYSNDCIEIINDIQDKGNIQMLKQELKINSLVGQGKTKINVKDNIPIDNIDNIAEILKVQINIVNQDIKISYNKVLTKAELNVCIMYLTEDNRINMLEYNLPIVGFIDIKDIADGNICDVNYEIKNIILKPNSQDEHSICIEADIEVVCFAYEEKQINVIQDLYSPNFNLNFEKTSVMATANKQNVEKLIEIRENINLPDISGWNLIEVNIIPSITNENKINSKILYEAELNLKFIFMNQQLNTMIKETQIPFQFVLDNLQDGESLNTDVDMEIANKDFIVQDNGNISCNIDIKSNTNMYRSVGINTINTIEEAGPRDEQDYSVVLYVVQKGDNLWNIAKRFGTTVDSIVRINGIENPDVIMPGQKLYISKFIREFQQA